MRVLQRLVLCADGLVMAQRGYALKTLYPAERNDPTERPRCTIAEPADHCRAEYSGAMMHGSNKCRGCT